MVNQLLERFVDTIEAGPSPEEELTPKKEARAILRRFVDFSARYPEYQRIILFEVIQNGEMLEWLSNERLSRYTDESVAWVKRAQKHGVYRADIDPFFLYLMTQFAAQSVFLMAPYIKIHSGRDVFASENIDAFYDSLMKFFGFEDGGEEQEGVASS